ncbi:heparin lyase I family protein [Alteromonas sp. KUL106]|uniref:heparin lyase I family protein n=1 Tax=Alteromonas sp. KUL106 TaxID=2480799 RepID=UPI0012E4C4DA|nr:heparin lyase I family protein [Alteromonas sp. KUL106]GFD69176.1 hypothetical protein KUL106_24390 [Alteromonas sp. KUL106]
MFLGFAFYAMLLASDSLKLSIPIGDTDGIRNPHLCAEKINDGHGDLLTSQVMLRGKCEGNGQSASIANLDGRNALQFLAAGESLHSKVSRTELALTSLNLEFDKPITITFDLMIPSSADVTNGFYYLMQFWQCSPLSPLGGIRVVRGSSHKINFMTRGDDSEVGSSFYSLELKPGEWTALELRLNVSSEDEFSYFEVWSKGALVGKRIGPFGFSSKFSCKGNSKAPEHFRLKLGIYKEYEDKKRFEAFFDNIQLTFPPSK